MHIHNARKNWKDVSFVAKVAMVGFLALEVPWTISLQQ
jgi:hypothetical protein